MAVSYMTKDGYDKILAEINYLDTVKRPEISAQIAEARDKGDLSENAEYDAAKDEQRDIETRIDELEAILKNVEVVVSDDVDIDKISIGCTVDLLDVEFDETLEYKIVGSTEASSLSGYISNESPLGKALIGSKVGQTITVAAPAGDVAYKILSIRRTENN